MTLKKLGIHTALFGAALLFAIPARAAEETNQAQGQGSAQQQAPKKKHSKAKGAIVGGAGGAVVGGKKGAAIGAAGGALYQHHKNKKEAKAQEKAQKQQ
jgi:hypothetical protein